MLPKPTGEEDVNDGPVFFARCTRLSPQSAQFGLAQAEERDAPRLQHRAASENGMPGEGVHERSIRHPNRVRGRGQGFNTPLARLGRAIVIPEI